MDKKSKKLRAKELYFEYKTAPEISAALNISIDSLKEWIHGPRKPSLKSSIDKSWKSQREEMQEIEFETFKERHGKHLNEALIRTLRMMDAALDTIQSLNSISFKELKLLSEAYLNLCHPTKSTFKKCG